MKKQGFTLIELLAVIVILAIIALIAVPIILNIVGNSKKSAVVRSGELYLKSVETAIARKNLNNQFNPTSCIIGSDGNLICDGDKTLTIEANGSKPISGTITLQKGKITTVEKMILDGYELEKKENDRLKIVGESSYVPPVLDDYKDETGAVIDLPTGLTPVVYSDNAWKVADTKNKWYDYAQQEWANAVILNAEVTKTIGDTVDVSSEIKGMFVYIPRYEYKIEGQYGTHTDGTAGTQEQPGEIKVNFISKEVTNASEGYILHPAFTFGTTELSGIWVGKFETTGDAATPTILPNVRPLTNQTTNSQFLTSQKFKTYINNLSIDVHMSKSNEWGAAAYLSQSKYGKYGNSNYVGVNKQVMINNCLITGVGADSQNASAASVTCTTNTYETTNGQAASTTGNITGIYDMSGGASDHVMGYLTIASEIWGATSSSNDAGFLSAPDTKYYDNYSTEDMATACNSGVCYGHALSETMGWYEDYSFFVNSNAPWMEHGGTINHTTGAGMFDFYYGNGRADNVGGFRVVLVSI